MMVLIYFLFVININFVCAYSRRMSFINNSSTKCSLGRLGCNGNSEIGRISTTDPNARKSDERRNDKPSNYDLRHELMQNLYMHLYGDKDKKKPDAKNSTSFLRSQSMEEFSDMNFDINIALDNYPDGQIMRGELFLNKSQVHFPPHEYLKRDHMLLNVTNDLMQTAVNAFLILLAGTVNDVENIPAEYVLKSARSIAMMKLTREKLAVLWKVVKRNRDPSEVKFDELEMYRPLFKYVNAREIARLNLRDTKILNYIGTHSDLNRHQVGVVASKYMTLNKNWTAVKYLNHMNNLLCGVPINFMRRIPSSTYLKLSHQVFYHIRACDPLQKNFYLGMMTRPEALGKSYSWSSRDVARLGLLLSVVKGPDLAAINPESMAGITDQVMMALSPKLMEYFTSGQIRYLALKPHSIFVKKIKAYHDESLFNYCPSTNTFIIHWTILFLIYITILQNVIAAYK